MVGTYPPECRYIVNAGTVISMPCLRGENVGVIPGSLLASGPLRPRETGVLVSVGPSIAEPVRPLALIARGDDVQWLCGRYAQLHTELSPLTAWCHLLSPEDFFKSGRRCHICQRLAVPRPLGAG